MRQQEHSTSTGKNAPRASAATTRAFAAVLLASLCGIALGDGLTAERFVTIEIAVREMTVKDMETRLAFLQADAYDAEQQQAEAAAAEIGRFYAARGTTPHGHAGYGAAHAQAIADWLDAHPAEQAHLYDLERQFETLSGQFNLLMTGGE